ncbi:MAG: DNA gyrase inhibitor YacG [Bdellovibrionales bacterium]
MAEREIKCPTCGKITTYSPQNPHRPFCSERCQTLDLGEWASEKRAIPGEHVKPEDEVNQNQNNDDEEPEPPPRHHLN